MRTLVFWRRDEAVRIVRASADAVRSCVQLARELAPLLTHRHKPLVRAVVIVLEPMLPMLSRSVCEMWNAARSKIRLRAQVIARRHVRTTRYSQHLSSGAFDRLMQLKPVREPLLRVDSEWLVGAESVTRAMLQSAGALRDRISHRSLFAKLVSVCAGGVAERVAS